MTNKLKLHHNKLKPPLLWVTIFYWLIEPLIVHRAPEKEGKDVFANCLCVLNRDTNAHADTKHMYVMYQKSFH